MSRQAKSDPSWREVRAALNELPLGAESGPRTLWRDGIYREAMLVDAHQTGIYKHR